jgi:hypothetical protein
MGNIIKIKRGVTGGIVPVGLTFGELAVNIVDKKLFIGGITGETTELLGSASEISGSSFPIASNTITGAASFDPRFFSVGGTGHVVFLGATGTETWANVDSGYANGIASGITFSVGSSAISVLEKLIYPYQPVSFSNFTIGLSNNIFDLGQTSAAGNYSASWNTSGPASNWVAGSLNIAIVSGSNLATNINYNSSPYNISHSAYLYLTPSTLSFSLTGQQASGTVIVTAPPKTYSWLHRIYYGKSSSSAPSSISNLTTGQTNRYTSSPSSLGNYTYSFTSSAIAEYCYVIVPTSPGTPGSYTTWRDENNLTFTPQEGTFTEVNSHGVSISWKWYKVANPTTGAISVSAS